MKAALSYLVTLLILFLSSLGLMATDEAGWQSDGRHFRIELLATPLDNDTVVAMPRDEKQDFIIRNNDGRLTLNFKRYIGVKKRYDNTNGSDTLEVYDDGRVVEDKKWTISINSSDVLSAISYTEYTFSGKAYRDGCTERFAIKVTSYGSSDSSADFYTIQIGTRTWSCSIPGNDLFPSPSIKEIQQEFLKYLLTISSNKGRTYKANKKPALTK